jgi:hypothetical protein
MKQRKLTGEEISVVRRAKECLVDMCGWSLTNRGSGYWAEVSAELEHMLKHGTTDGNPYIEPQPEIGEGYRVATEADRDRRDIEYWSPTEKAWSIRQAHLQKTPLSESYHYRVPIDRIPTDDDARQRPDVMVRDGSVTEWLKRPLLAVVKRSPSFVVQSDEGFTTWRYCRFPYPGE